MTLIPPVTAAKLPYRVDRSAPGVVTLEKHFGDFNPNCVLGVLILVCSIIIPAFLSTVSPLASGLVFVGSFIFPGIPVGTVNKKWRIDINNIGHEMHVSRWHDFNKKNKKTSTIKFDDIKEILAETSPDGMKHVLVILDQANARHVLHETMNKAHASHFKDDFMNAIELAGSGILLASHAQAQAAQVARAPVIAPALRQIAVPVLNNVQDRLAFEPNNSIPQNVGAALSHGGDVHGSTTSSNPAGESSGDNGNSIEAVHARLMAIAKHKREVLMRVYAPGTDAPDAVHEALSNQGSTGEAEIKEATKEVERACSHLRNRSEMFNIFDPCFASLGFIPQELAGNTRDFPKVVDGDPETLNGRTPKKKNDDGEDAQIGTRHPDKKTEKELNVQKVRPTCMVCTRPLKGTNFICPTCETKYCIRCARALADRKESCWTCRKRIQLA